MTVFPPEKLKLEKLDIEVALKTRIMILLIGILIHKFKNSPCLFPAGASWEKNFDASHLRLGKIWDKNKGQGREYEISRNKLVPCENLIIYESGDTATENAILYALIGGKTVIKFASANYQVQDLCHFLVGFGCEDGRNRNDHLDHFRPGKLKSRISFSIKRGPDRSDVFLTAKNRDEIVNCHKAMPAGLSGTGIAQAGKNGIQI